MASFESVATVIGPIRSHLTPTSNEAWSGARVEARLVGAPMAKLRRVHAWVDPGVDSADRSAYRFLHHEVSARGLVGAANIRACVRGLEILHQVRGDHALPEVERQRVHLHLVRHLRSAGWESFPGPPEATEGVERIRPDAAGEPDRRAGPRP